jgi:hypothetical protein
VQSRIQRQTSARPGSIQRTDSGRVGVVLAVLVNRAVDGNVVRNRAIIFPLPRPRQDERPRWLDGEIR